MSKPLQLKSVASFSPSSYLLAVKADECCVRHIDLSESGWFRADHASGIVIKHPCHRGLALKTTDMLEVPEFAHDSKILEVILCKYCMRHFLISPFKQ